MRIVYARKGGLEFGSAGKNTFYVTQDGKDVIKPTKKSDTAYKLFKKLSIGKQKITPLKEITELEEYLEFIAKEHPAEYETAKFLMLKFKEQ